MSEPSGLIDTPLLLGIPSKGRLQENCKAFFEGAGIRFVQARGGRAYQGRVADIDDIEVLFLSASEIAGQLASGAIHLGVTGEDLLRESIHEVERRVVLITPLGFGEANVVVAVPQAWIDVRTMADLADIASSFRHHHARRLRVATKYLNLTRNFFAQNDIADYLIIESLGATEGAPSSGAADLIVDITTTGGTLAANGLRVLEDGLILRSEAQLVASQAADWNTKAREAAGILFSRIAARARASQVKEVRCIVPNASTVAETAKLFGATLPFGLPRKGEAMTLHVPAQEVYALSDWLTGEGAKAILINTVEFVFSAENLFLRHLEERLAAS